MFPYMKVSAHGRMSKIKLNWAFTFSIFPITSSGFHQNLFYNNKCMRVEMTACRYFTFYNPRYQHINYYFQESWNCQKWKVKSLSLVWLFVIPWTVPYQAPPSMGFSRQEYWSRLPFPWVSYYFACQSMLYFLFCFPIVFPFMFNRESILISTLSFWEVFS